MTQAAVMFPQQQAHLALMYVKSAMHSQWKNQSVTVTQNAQRKNPIRIALYEAVKTGIFPAAWEKKRQKNPSAYVTQNAPRKKAMRIAPCVAVKTET